MLFFINGFSTLWIVIISTPGCWCVSPPIINEAQKNSHVINWIYEYILAEHSFFSLNFAFMGIACAYELTSRPASHECIWNSYICNKFKNLQSYCWRGFIYLSRFGDSALMCFMPARCPHSMCYTRRLNLIGKLLFILSYRAPSLCTLRQAEKKCQIVY